MEGRQVAGQGGRCRWDTETANGVFLIRLVSIGYRSRDKDGEVSERKGRTEVSGVKWRGF
jgi:hypothetical protein